MFRVLTVRRLDSESACRQTLILPDFMANVLLQVFSFARSVIYGLHFKYPHKKKPTEVKSRALTGLANFLLLSIQRCENWWFNNFLQWLCARTYSYWWKSVPAIIRFNYSVEKEELWVYNLTNIFSKIFHTKHQHVARQIRKIYAFIRCTKKGGCH